MENTYLICSFRNGRFVDTIRHAQQLGESCGIRKSYYNDTTSTECYWETVHYISKSRFRRRTKSDLIKYSQYNYYYFLLSLAMTRFHLDRLALKCALKSLIEEYKLMEYSVEDVYVTRYERFPIIVELFELMYCLLVSCGEQRAADRLKRFHFGWASHIYRKSLADRFHGFHISRSFVVSVLSDMQLQPLDRPFCRDDYDRGAFELECFEDSTGLWGVHNGFGCVVIEARYDSLSPRADGCYFGERDGMGFQVDILGNEYNFYSHASCTITDYYELFGEIFDRNSRNE